MAQQSNNAFVVGAIAGNVPPPVPANVPFAPPLPQDALPEELAIAEHWGMGIANPDQSHDQPTGEVLPASERFARLQDQFQNLMQ